VRNFFQGISPACGVRRVAPGVGLGLSDSAFQRLSNAEATTVIVNSAAYFGWAHAVSTTAGARTGQVFEMRPSSDSGGRSLQAQETRRPSFIVP